MICIPRNVVWRIITEVVFLQKDAEGKWLRKDAIDKLPEKERTPAVTEVLRIAKELYRAS